MFNTLSTSLGCHRFSAPTILPPLNSAGKRQSTTRKLPDLSGRVNIPITSDAEIELTPCISLTVPYRKTRSTLPKIRSHTSPNCTSSHTKAAHNARSHTVSAPATSQRICIIAVALCASIELHSFFAPPHRHFQFPVLKRNFRTYLNK